ncbi:hypothetical protein DERP_001075 [Dermatophagoides pteronyssinus]|uniref:Uncharacterized protein n=1 Tax=Dermatophagoides pteronyssinus TaxID=6956 RepID=A0ABQ8JDG5_DERPT|nr:hypothetical protein DERP_001075 [Dermatophagoides pteronyssinus]
MNKELMLIQFSKYITIATVSIIIGMILALICLWIYSEWLIYQQKKTKQLDLVRDKMDGIEMKRLLRQNSFESNKQKPHKDAVVVDISDNNDDDDDDVSIKQSNDNNNNNNDTATEMASSDKSMPINTNKGISLKSLDGLPH